MGTDRKILHIYLIRADGLQGDDIGRVDAYSLKVLKLGLVACRSSHADGLAGRKSM